MIGHDVKSHHSVYTEIVWSDYNMSGHIRLLSLIKYMPYSVLNFVILDTIFDVVFVTLPYLRGGQALRIPAQC